MPNKHALTCVIALTVLCGLFTTTAHASDHNEPQSLNAISPDVLSDAADIYGNFVWPTDNSVVFVLTFPAPPFGFGYLPGPGPEEIYDESHPHAYDDDVLYAIHIDRDWGLIGDRNIVDKEISMTIRFGYDAKHKTWGVRVEGIPEVRGAVVGPVNETLETETGALVRAGIFDEPFFFDLERFFVGQQTGNLDFRPEVDFFRGWNVHAVVIEVPKRDVATFTRRQLGVWTTSHRLPNDPFIRPGNACR